MGTLVAIMFLLALVLAHDTWVLPDQFVAEPEEQVRCRVITTDDFPIPDAPVAQSRLQSAQIWDGTNWSEITQISEQGDALEMIVSANVPCHLIVAVALKPHFIEMDRDNFIEYLRSENAWAAVEQMNSNPSLGTRELYSKFARTRIVFGMGSCPEIPQILPFEIDLELALSSKHNPQITNDGVRYVRAHRIRRNHSEHAEWISEWASLTFSL